MHSRFLGPKRDVKDEDDNDSDGNVTKAQADKTQLE